MASKREQEDFLFVYGTLRKGAGHKMHGILARYGEPAGKASLQARLYDLGAYPGAVISQNPADVVLGEMYALNPTHLTLALAALDEYEGVREFRREKHTVTLENGDRVGAWVYVYCRDPQNAQYIPSGDYLARVKSEDVGESQK